jgi:UDP-glucuronate decarboxylase
MATANSGDNIVRAAHAIVAEDIDQIVAGVGHDAMRLEGAVVLITGGAGFLGSYIRAALQALNREVLTKPCKLIIVDNFFIGSRHQSIASMDDDPNVTILERDVRQPVEIDGTVDYLLHAAGVPSPVYYREYPIETIETAVWGTKHTSELARRSGAKSFLFFSSSEIYGDPHSTFIPTPETYRGNVSSVGPRSCYDESKRLSEALCMAYFHRYNVPVRIVRPFNVYGPGMKTNDYRVIPSFISRALQGQPLQVYNTGTQTRTFCYVTDAVIGFLKVLLRGTNGEAYNVGNDLEEMSMLHLAQLVVQVCGGGQSVQRINYPETYPADEPQRRLPDLTKIRTELHYGPSVDLRSGLERTLAWFQGVSRSATV